MRLWTGILSRLPQSDISIMVIKPVPWIMAGDHQTPLNWPWRALKLVIKLFSFMMTAFDPISRQYGILSVSAMKRCSSELDDFISLLFPT